MKVAALVVTYNRLELLKECIAAIRKQTRPPDAIYVVNNNSSDGTMEWISSYTDLLPINLSENKGGAGGFNVGIRVVFSSSFNFCWTMDDDTIPYEDCLESLLDTVNINKSKAIGWVASNILWSDGEPHKMNNVEIIEFNLQRHTVLQKKFLQAIRASFVSLLINYDAVKKVGLPIADMFIWFDDSEFTRRINRNGFNCYFALKSIAVHKSEKNTLPCFNDLTDENFWKYRLYVRNMVINFRSEENGLFWALLKSMLHIKRNHRNEIFKLSLKKRVILFLSLLNGFLTKITRETI